MRAQLNFQNKQTCVKLDEELYEGDQQFQFSSVQLILHINIDVTIWSIHMDSFDYKYKKKKKI